MSLFKYGKQKLSSIELFTQLSKKYNTCEVCGSQHIGNGEGTLDFDSSGEQGYYRRTCKCGWEKELYFDKSE